MTEKCCRTCKWWRRWESSGGESAQIGACELTVRQDAKAKHPESRAVASGAEGRYAVLDTIPAFLCSQYEARE